MAISSKVGLTYQHGRYRDEELKGDTENESNVKTKAWIVLVSEMDLELGAEQRYKPMEQARW